MKTILAFAFAVFGSAFLAGDTLGCEDTDRADKDPIVLLDNDSDCNVQKRNRVIPTRL